MWTGRKCTKLHSSYKHTDFKPVLIIQYTIFEIDCVCTFFSCIYGVEYCTIMNSWDTFSLQWRQNERNGVCNHRRLDCILKRLFRCRWEKISELCVTGLWAGKSPVTVEFPTQRASNAEMPPLHDIIMFRFCEYLSRNYNLGNSICCVILTIRSIM